MRSESALVLDANVLSSARAAGWFDAPAFWSDEFEVLISDRVWRDEFAPAHPEVDVPPWLSLVEATVSERSVHTPGQLSEHDWRCVDVAETNDGALVTNDKPLYDRFEARGGPSIWGTKFLKRTYERCGVDPDAFESGVDAYVDDVYLPPAVADELRNAEKDESLRDG